MIARAAKNAKPAAAISESPLPTKYQMVPVGTIWYFVGRGLSEIAAAGFAFFAALAIMRAGGRMAVAAAAGALAVLMFYARLNQLIFALFLAALWLRRDVDAAW